MEPTSSQPSAEVLVRRALTMLKEGLSHYLLEVYQNEFGPHWEAEIRSATRQFKHLDFRTDERLLASLDTQGCLDLILKRRDVFTRRLGRVGVAYASELLETRNTLGHEISFTFDDVLRACDTVARLLDLVFASDLAYETRELARSVQTSASPSEPEQRTFAWQIRSQLSQLGQTIIALTEDQFRILEWLRSYRRAAVSGCAGSGKTLVAMEKALRLDRAGFTTLVLCHNPFLAKDLRSLAAQSRVRVFDFAEWVGSLIGRPVTGGGTWSQYDEPTEAEVEEAFDRLSASDRYDAVIVDEGQDFPEVWWLLVEQALLSQSTGILYIFHDDNQALLPFRSKYPVTDSPFIMSKNCRNAGAIFEIVRRLHPHAPDPSVLLAGRGICRRTTYSASGEADAVRAAVEEAAMVLPTDRLIVLTNEACSPDRSELSGLTATIKPRTRWQDPVTRALISIARRLGRRVRRSAGPHPPLLLPSLSDEPFPTKDDIEAVTSFARPLAQSHEHPSLIRGVRWQELDGSLILKGLDVPTQVAVFFASERWADALPKPREVVVGADVPLWTVAAFKGLEADGIIFAIRANQHHFDANLYVGVSRAKFYLHIVADVVTATRLPFISEA